MRRILCGLVAIVGVGVGVAHAQPTDVGKPAAPELIAAQRAQIGSYRCRGNVVANVDEKRKVTGKLVVSAALDGRWLVWRLDPGRGPKSKPVRYVIYRSFDAATKTWNATQLDTVGGRAELSAPDAADGKLTWTGTYFYRGMQVQIRDHQEPVAGGFRLWGEYETEPGLFLTSYDVTCKK